MRVDSITLKNFKAHQQTGPLELGPVTVFVGPNNAGKSSILQALYGLQAPLEADSIRRGAASTEITLTVSALQSAPGWQMPPSPGDDRGTIVISPGVNLGVTSTAWGSAGRNVFASEEPNHFVIPFLSKRKVQGFAETTSIGETHSVRPDLHHLPAKLSRIANPAFPGHQRFASACKEILGHVITNVASAGGQKAGIYVDQDTTITIEAMGDGVPHIVGLLAELVIAKEKLFLIEELENDLHPAALKALLRLIAESAESNQFVITTHSHIVTRHLGSLDGSRVYNVAAEPDSLPPIAVVEEVRDTASRVRVLRELGYELSDFDLWDAWLILEESSAERLIRDFLIPWFVPQIQGRIRTMAVGGTGNVEPGVENFDRLFLFAHLEESYRDRAWVLVDGDPSGKEVIERLVARYGGKWSVDHFVALPKPAFERYYPPRFGKQANAALAITDRQNKRAAKKALLQEVLEWCRAEPRSAKMEFKQSAAEVISFLKTVGKALSK